MGRFSIHRLANIEYVKAVNWYVAKSISLTERFIAEVGRTYDVIIQQPERYTLLKSSIRQAPLKGFPYSIIYRVENNGDVVVIAVAHAKRRPNYWARRR